MRACVVERVGPGLYVAALLAADARARVDAAARWSAPAGAVGGWSALWLLGLTALAPERVMIAAPHEFKRSPLPFATVRRFTFPIPSRALDGRRVVPPVDALIQAWEELPAERRVGITLDALRAGSLTGALVQRRLDDYPRVRERAALLRVLDKFGDGVTSFLEHRARTRVFHTAAFRGFSWQAPVNVRGRTYVADMLHRDARLAIELDGRAYHGDHAARLRDLQRDADFSTLGISTLRLTYDDIVRRPAWCRETVLLALRARAGRFTAIEGVDRGGSPRTRRRAR